MGGAPEDAAVPDSVEEAAATPLTARRDHNVRLSAAPQDAEEWVGEPVPVGSPVVRTAATAATTGGAYVSPCLRTSGEWVGEPMPIGTPVSRPAPVQAEEAPAPERTVVTVRPLRRDVSPDEIARQLGKPSLVPTDKSALITPPPRGGAAAGPAPRPAVQTPFPKSVPAGESRAVPGSKDVSSPPDVTPDTNALLSSHQEGPSRTRAAANTLMRFLSRFHAGSDQAADGEQAPQAPAAEPERQGRPQPIRKADGARPETASAATGNPWIERRIEDRPSAPVRVPVPPRPSGSSGRPQPPDDPANPLPALMWRLDNHLAEAGHALEQRRLHLVADAAGRLAAEAESYGFRVLGRMARCVERAGRAKDLQAVTDLLPELATALERHRISLDS